MLLQQIPYAKSILQMQLCKTEKKEKKLMGKKKFTAESNFK